MVLAFWLPGKGMMKYTLNISAAKRNNKAKMSGAGLFIEEIYKKIHAKLES